MNNYEPLEIIGTGSFGVIRKVRRRSDGKILARKEIDYRRMSTAEKKQLVAEVNILRELKHPHIVRYYERFVDRDSCLIYIIMEFCEGGDLAAVIRRCIKDGKVIPEERVWMFFTQLLMALHECHHGAQSVNGAILHRDIKPENVFLDNGNNVKLGDFGLSRVLDEAQSKFAKTFVGTPYYMAPEIVRETIYNTKSDVWALGCLLYETCALRPPFEAKTQQELNEKIKMGIVSRLPYHYSDELNSIIQSMLSVDQRQRPSISRLLDLSRIKLCAREMELVQLQLSLIKKQEELDSRERNLSERERSLKEREMAFQKWSDERTQSLLSQEKISTLASIGELNDKENNADYSARRKLLLPLNSPAKFMEMTPEPITPLRRISSNISSRNSPLTSRSTTIPLPVTRSKTEELASRLQSIRFSDM